jgi:hypothetical protein
MQVGEKIYYEFWIRAENIDDATLATFNLDIEDLYQNISDSEEFEIYETDSFEEEELVGWVKNRILDAKDYINLKEGE